MNFEPVSCSRHGSDMCGDSMEKQVRSDAYGRVDCDSISVRDPGSWFVPP